MDHEPEYPAYDETPHDATPYPQPHPTPYGDAVAVPAPRHAKSRRVARLALGTAAVLAIAAGGYGVGAAVGAHNAPSSASSPTLLNRPNTTQPGTGQGGYSYGFGGFGDQGGSPGSGNQGGSPSFGNQRGFSGFGDQGGSSSSQATRTATKTELTGLVRVDSTLGYQDGEAAGTGMVLTSNGEVITNHHVVAGATSVKVTVLSTGQNYTAKVVGTDSTDDVAVLQLKDASGLSTVTTDPVGVAVGDSVTAVGDAGGSATTFTAAPGKVSAIDQPISTEAEGSAAGERLTGMIEISADVMSGDSGGATYDSNGDVVGMTTAASTGNTDVDGFAIPISRVLSIAGDLESGVSGAHYVYGNPAFLGIGLGSGTGTTVQGVYDGTAAAKAGLAAGDTITKLGSTRTSTASQLERAVATHSPGDTVTLTWTDTSGHSHTASVTLGTGPIS